MGNKTLTYLIWFAALALLTIDWAAYNLFTMILGFLAIVFLLSEGVKRLPDGN
jgi:hypothetical protein